MYPTSFGFQSLKRPHDGTQEVRNSKRLCLNEINTVQQFIEEMNALITMNIGNQEKEALLMNKIISFHASEKIPALIYNPFYGMRITQIVQGCLQLAPNNEVFKSMMGFAETVYLPLDLIEKIFGMLFVSRSWKEMLQSTAVNHEESAPSLFNSIGLVSKTWRKSLFRIFAPKMSWKQLKQLKIVKAEDVIQLAEICQGQISRLHLADDKMLHAISFSKKQLCRLLPLISNIEELQINPSIHSESFALIVNSPHMNNLKSFSMHYRTTKLKRQVWESLEQTTHFKNLTSLCLRSSSLNGEKFKAILKVPFLSQIKVLDLSGNPIKDGLVNCQIKPNFANLEALDLSDCQLSDLGELANFDMPNLQILDLSLNPINLEQLIALKGSKLGHAVEELVISIQETPKEVEALLLAFPKLLKLEINSEMIDVEGVAAILASSSAVQQLKKLNLGSLVVPEDEMISLLGSKFLPNLKNLIVNNPLIGPLGLSAFKNSPFQLEKLSLIEANFGENGDAMSILTTAPSTAQLEELSLEECFLNDEAQEILALASDFKTLKTLDLVGTNFCGEHLLLLSENPHFGNLENLMVNNNPIEPETLIQVAQSEHLKNLNNFLFDFDADSDPSLVLSVQEKVKEILAQKRLGKPPIEAQKDVPMKLEG